MRLVTEQWFDEDNLWPLYTELAFLAGHVFTQADRAAIELGISSVDETEDKWFDYVLEGKQPIRTSITKYPGSSNYNIRIFCDSGIDREVFFLLSVCQDWKISEF